MTRIEIKRFCSHGRHYASIACSGQEATALCTDQRGKVFWVKVLSAGLCSRLPVVILFRKKTFFTEDLAKKWRLVFIGICGLLSNLFPLREKLVKLAS
jgi:hypothetical protein